jgi:hypothetical protein
MEMIEAGLFLSKKLVNLFDECHEFLGVLLHRRLLREHSATFFVFALH